MSDEIFFTMCDTETKKENRKRKRTHFVEFSLSQALIITNHHHQVIPQQSQLTRVFKLWVERSDMRLGPGVARELEDKHKKAHSVGHGKARIYTYWKEQECRV